MKKLALFDVDRTLTEGRSIGVFITDRLFEEGLFPEKCQQKINRAIDLNKKGRMSYQKRGEIIIKNWAEGFTGWKRKDIIRASTRIFNKEFHKHLSEGAKPLVTHLKKRTYYTCAISRAYEECLIPFKNHLGINHVIGTRFAYQRNTCTGGLLNETWKAGAKEKAIMELFKQVNLTTEDSVAFGDTEDDYYMLKFVEYPITVNVNKALERIAFERHWPIYNDLTLLLRDIQSKKLLPAIDWMQHYSKKYGHIILNEDMLHKAEKNNEAFMRYVKKYVKGGGNILEVGCGLGRTAIVLSLNGYTVTAIDSERRILKVAQINTFNFGKDIHLRLMDAFDIDTRFKKKRFDAVTHEGVLEHFSENQIKILLDKQLKVAPLVIFSVPVRSKRNDTYFKNDQMGHRYLWSKSEWMKFLENFYTIQTASLNKSVRKDELIAALTKKK